MNTGRMIAIAAAVALLLPALAPAALADDEACGDQCKLAANSAKPQTKCPVMGGKINKDVYADVNGYRVYACCPACLPKIKAEPKKYLQKVRDNGETPEKLVSAKPAGHIDTAGLATLVRAKVPVVILDARSKVDKVIPGATVLTAKSTKEQVEKAVPEKDSLVVAYCANLKCPASKHLAKHLRSLGYTNVLVYPEGIEGWIKAGHPVEDPKS